MELTGERIIAAPPDRVWQGLNDPRILRRAIPGCKEMQGSADRGYEAVVTQKIGPVKATFRGRVELSDIVEGRAYRISGTGRGGAAGFASGAADVRLEAVAEGTRLVYEVEAKLGGKLASLGGRVIGGVAKKLADQFFTAFGALIEEGGEGAGEGEGEREGAASAPGGAEGPQGPGAKAPPADGKSNGKSDGESAA